MRDAIPVVLMVACSLFLLGGCGILFQGQAESPEGLAMLASSVSEYNTDSMLGAMADMERDDALEGARTVTTEVTVRHLPDGTEVTIARSYDDRDTPSDPTDDVVTVVRAYDMWNGLERVETVVRPARPDTAWTNWDESNRIVQAGITIEETVAGVRVRSGVMSLAWELVEGVAILRALERRVEGLDPGGSPIVNLVSVTYADGGRFSKTLVRIRITGGQEVVVHSVSFEEIPDADNPGQTDVRITRDDGSYVIVRERGDPRTGDPRVVDRYDTEGTRLSRVTEVRRRNQETGAVDVDRTVVLYDTEGNVIDTYQVLGSVQYTVTEDGITLTRRFSNGRLMTVSIEETSDGYRVERAGPFGSASYQVQFAGDEVRIYDESGTLFATVVVLDDGAWTVIYTDPNRESEAVYLG